jgi:hypothetical protein
MMAPYTTNLVTNPSFEDDLTGYTAIGFTVLAQDVENSMFGNCSMVVTTDGSAAGQGFSTAQVSQGPGTYSFSFYADAQTPVDVRIVIAINPGGVVVLSPTVTLAQGWARYTVQGISAPVGTASIYANIVTLAANAVTFNIDAVQLEPKATVTEYCDGDQYGCVWTGDPNASTSTRDVRFPLIEDGDAASSGDLVIYSPQIPVPLAVSGVSQSAGTLTVLSGTPAAVFDNFAMYRSTDPDPVVSYCVASNAGTNDGGYQQPWTRHWMLAVPPANAAYAAVGMHYGTMASGDWHYLHMVQLAVYPINSQIAIGPTAYVTPRQITTTVKPTRLNFAKNPGFASSTNYWSMLSSATLTRDTTTPARFGTTSGAVSIRVNNGYVQHDIDNLIAGRTYTVSAYIKMGTGLSDLFLSAASDANSVSYSSFASAQPGEDWVRLSFSFDADTSRDHIRFTGALAPGQTSGNFWIDGVLIEENTLLLDYFDGSFGFDYLWEAGGVAGESRSYWYQGRRFKQYLVSQVVQQNNPMGITSAEPVYAVPYTQ